MEIGAFLVLAEFLADGLQLLAKNLVALQFADGALHLVLDLRLELEDLDLLTEEQGQQPEPLEHVLGFEHVLLLLQRLVRRRGHQVGEIDRIVGF